MPTISARVTEEEKALVDRIAERDGVDRSHVVRVLVDHGWRATRYYPEEFPAPGDVGRKGRKF